MAGLPKTLPEFASITPNYLRQATNQLMFFDIRQSSLSCSARALKLTDADPRPDNEFCQPSGTSCQCGAKAQCFDSDDSNQDEEPLRVRLDKAVTATFMAQFDDDPLGLLKVFEALYVTGTHVLQTYAVMNRLQYGQDLILLFKGGNVFRMMFEKTLHELSPDEMCAACKEWSELLGVSDLDFDVYLRDASETRVREVTVLMALVMDAARAWLLQNRRVWTPTESQLAPVRKVTSTVGMDMNTFRFETGSTQSDSVISPLDRNAGIGAQVCKTCNTLFMPVPHVLRSKDHGKGSWFRPMPPNGTAFPMSFNRTLGNLYKTVKVNANLLRVRRSVSVHLGNCRKKCAAEVYDLTIAHADDYKHRLIVASPDIDWFQRVTYKRPDGTIGTMWTPSLWHFFEDLFITMFVTNTRPWLANRLEKRIYRWTWVAAMLSMVEDPNVSVSHVAAQVTATADVIRRQGNASNIHSKALARILQSLQTLRLECEPGERRHVDKFEKDVFEALDRTARTLLAASGDMHVDLKKLQTNVSLSRRNSHQGIAKQLPSTAAFSR